MVEQNCAEICVHSCPRFTQSLARPCLAWYQRADHELRLLVLHGVEQDWRLEGDDVRIPSQVRGSAGSAVRRLALFGPWVY